MSEVSSERSSSYSSSSGDEHDDEVLHDDELGNFLLDALSGFDPQADDVIDVVAL
jgi:hypothetical protein